MTRSALRRSRSTAAAALSGLFLLIRPVRAGVGVDPVIVTTSALPGRAVRGAFRVVNDGAGPVEVDVEPESWPPSMEKRPVDWLVLKPRRFTVQPGKEAVVSYKATVPKAASGEVAAQVYFASMVTRGGAMPLMQRFGCALYVYAAGTERWEGSVEKVSEKELGDERIFEVSVKNAGNAHFRPKGRLTLFDAKDAVFAEVPLEGNWPVYAGTSRGFFARVKKDRIPAGKCYGLVHVEYGYAPPLREAELKFPFADLPSARADTK